MPLDEKALSGKEVRLFPSHHIKSNREAELRATASFLAVARAVSEFGRSVVSMAGGYRGKLRCYAEVPFKVQVNTKSREERPDGIMRITRGKTEWAALVEVKVGDNLLDQDQFDRYHILARDQGINALITISNQSALANGLPPRLTVDKRRLRSVPVFHLSWERLLSEAQLLSRRKEIADPDQQWMLEEWIRYIADDQSRIIEPPQMGEHWKEILQAAREHNLENFRTQMQDVVQRWDAFLKKVALRLRAKLGVDVQLLIPRAERKNPAIRIKNLQTLAIKNGELPGILRIPDAAGDLSVVVFLASKSVQYSIELAAPTDGRTKTRIMWLLRQLMSQDVPDDLVVQVNWDKRKVRSQARIYELKENIDGLMCDSSGKEFPVDALPRSFSLEWTIALPKGKGRSSAPVLDGIAEGVQNFYKRVVVELRPYVPRAPQLAEEEQKHEVKPDNEFTNDEESQQEATNTTLSLSDSQEFQGEEMSLDDDKNETS